MLFRSTDNGDRVPTTEFSAPVRSKAFPLAAGCRIHCLVTAVVSYSLNEIRLVVPQKENPEKIADLKARAKALRSKERGRVLAEMEFPETFTGVIESFDRREKTGVIRRTDGAKVLLLSTSRWIRKHQRVTPGMPVRFEAVKLSGEWVVHGKLSFDDAK